MTKRGKFLVFEGLDGAGKTSCVEYLKEHLEGDVVFTHEPGGTSVGEKLRTVLLSERLDPLTQFFLFLSDRREHMVQTIIPAIASGRNVICDRFMASTFAYQIFAGNLRDHEQVFWNAHRAILDDYEPDQTFFVTISPELAHERLKVRDLTPNVFEEKVEFQRKVREGYEEFFRKLPATVIDGGVPMVEMKENALQLVKKALHL